MQSRYVNVEIYETLILLINRDTSCMRQTLIYEGCLLELCCSLKLEFAVILIVVGFFPSGACEGTLACSTCHLIFEDHIFEKLDAITDEEMDMLDLAYGLTET